MKARWVYRSRQFFAALFSKVSNEEMAQARRALGPNLYKLFAAMPEQYRQHALTVYRRVVEAGCDEPVAHQAALLHDIGKYDPNSGKYVTIFHRVAVVLLETLPMGKRLLRLMSRQKHMRDFALYPFYLDRYHSVLGAKLAATYGASDEVVALIAGHHRRSGQSEHLLILQAADDNS